MVNGPVLDVEFHSLMSLIQAYEQVLFTCQQTGWRFRSPRGPVPTKDRISLNTPSSVFTLCLCLILTSPDFHQKAVVIYNTLVTSLLPNLSRSFAKPCPAMSTWTDPESLAHSGQKHSETLVKLSKMFLKKSQFRPTFLKYCGRYAQTCIKYHSPEPEPQIPLPPLSLRDPSPPHLSNFPTFLGRAPSVKGPIHGVNAAASADRALRQEVWPIPCSA